MTALAGAEAGLTSELGRREELHVLAPRLARRARWPAIDARRQDRGDEATIVTAVAVEEGAPQRVAAVVRFESCVHGCVPYARLGQRSIRILRWKRESGVSGCG
jgi:hypothetical protein